MLSKSIVSVQREFRRKFGDDRQSGAAQFEKNNRSVGASVA